MNAATAAFGSALLLGGSLLIAAALGRLLGASADRATALCRCGHTFSYHEHHHPRTYCGTCRDCNAYRPAPLPVRVTGRCRCGLAFDDCPAPILHTRR